jgi:hypothetical protein
MNDLERFMFQCGVNQLYLGLSSIKDALQNQDIATRNLEHSLFYETVKGIARLKDHLGFLPNKPNEDSANTSALERAGG